MVPNAATDVPERPQKLRNDQGSNMLK